MAAARSAGTAADAVATAHARPTARARPTAHARPTARATPTAHATRPAHPTRPTPPDALRARREEISAERLTYLDPSVVYLLTPRDKPQGELQNGSYRSGTDPCIAGANDDG